MHEEETVEELTETDLYWEWMRDVRDALDEMGKTELRVAEAHQIRAALRAFCYGVDARDYARQIAEVT